MITLKRLSHPDQIFNEWDARVDNFYMKKPFLTHLHTYNYCNQRYYELYENNRFVAGSIVYSLKINLFTFSKIRLILPMQVIGIPVSIAAEPLAGNRDYANILILKILEKEKGLILGINFKYDYLNNKVINLRALPTIIVNTDFPNFASYTRLLRHPYRRKLKKSIGKFSKVASIESECNEFTAQHYSLYLDIMQKTTTKLEVLSFDFFKKLPNNFILTTHYFKNIILAWQIITINSGTLYFFFGGINYDMRDLFNSYYNNLLSIVIYAIKHKYKNVDFGQTAELIKLRFGGVSSERKMFLFHKNHLLRLLIKLFKGSFTYSKSYKEPRVLKTAGDMVKSELYENNIYQA